MLLIAAQFFTEFLQFTVLASNAGETLLFMVAKYKLDGCLSALYYSFGISDYFHTFAYRIDTACHKIPCALDFDDAHSASTYGVDILKIT